MLCEMDLADFGSELEYSILGQRDEQVERLFDDYQTTQADSEILNSCKDLALYLCHGDYSSILQSPVAADLLGFKGSDETYQELHGLLRERVAQFLHEEDKDEAHCLRQMIVMYVGIACLQLFIQQNWTGPPLTDNVSDILPSCFRKFDQGVLQEMSIQIINQEGQCIYNLVEDPVYLLLANILLVDVLNKQTTLKTSYIWALRCLSIKQQLMEEHSNETMNQTMDLITKVRDDTSLLSDNNRQICCEVFLQLGHLFLYYWEMTKAKEYFTTVQDYLGIKLHLTGALGKRTKFQQNFLAQLRLEVDSIENNEKGTLTGNVNTDDLPKNVGLDDDTVLDKIKFKETDEAASLTPQGQALILALCVYSQKSQAVDELTSEELLAYIQGIVRQPMTWSVQMFALLMRSKLEKGVLRRAERSMMQLETLVNAIKQPDPKFNHRHPLFHCVPLPPKWKTERELARSLVSLGAVKGALEVFVRLQLWEDVITCYQSLGWHEKAEKLVREQLHQKETVTLWCLLGDITKDASHYEKAWELSNHRSSRAQRSVGLLHLRAVRYAECIPYLQRSLEINSLQEGVWFSLGCAAMATGDMELAGKAFHRCVSLDHNNGEAWNNLANVWIKRNNKPKAYIALQEALRSNYENWHMWDNFLVVSVDVGAFRDAIHAYHRMMDLRDKYKDVEILGFLVKAVNEGTTDINGTPASKFRPELLKLLGRITSQITNDSSIWRLYSDVHMTGDSPADKEKALGFLVKAHRVSTQDSSWETDLTMFKKSIEMTLNLAEVYEQVSAAKSDKLQSIQLLSSAKLAIKQLIAKAKKHHTDSLTEEIVGDLAVGVSDLEYKLQMIVDKIATLKS